MRLIRNLSVSLLAHSCLFSALAAEQPRLTADEMADEGESVVARGAAELNTDRFELRADTIRYHKQSRDATAAGSVSLTAPQGRLVTPEASWNTANKHLNSDQFRLGRHPILVEGENLTGEPGDLAAENVIVYFDEPGPFSPNIRARKARFLESNTIELQDATMRIGKLPIFHVPQYRQDNLDSPIDYRASAGYRDHLGPWVQTETRLRQGTGSLRPGIILDLYGKRGVLVGPSLQYSHSADALLLEGMLRSGYIRDQDEPGLDNLSRSIDRDRFFIDWRHKSYLGPHIELTGQINWWSDSEILRDFRDDWWDHDQEPASFFEGVWLGENITASALARFATNDWQITRQRLPEIRIDYAPNPLGETGFYVEGMASAARLDEHDPKGIIAKLRSDRVDAYAGLRYPMEVRKGVVFTPKVGGRITYYKRLQNARDTYTRLLGEVGFDLKATLSRTWELQNETWDVRGLRHVAEPFLSWRYLPEAQRGQSSITQIDRRVFQSFHAPIDLGSHRNIDELHELNVLRYGVQNRLETRAGDYGSRVLAWLNLYQDLHLSPRPGENEFATLNIEAGIQPAPWIDLSLFEVFSTEDLSERETRARLRLHDGDLWSLAFSADHLEGQFEQYWLDFQLRLGERTWFKPSFRYDAQLDKLTEQIYAIRQRIGENWDLEYALSYLDGNDRDDGLGFTIRVDLLNF